MATGGSIPTEAEGCEMISMRGLELEDRDAGDSPLRLPSWRQRRGLLRHGAFAVLLPSQQARAKMQPLLSRCLVAALSSLFGLGANVASREKSTRFADLSLSFLGERADVLRSDDPGIKPVLSASLSHACCRRSRGYCCVRRGDTRANNSCAKTHPRRRRLPREGARARRDHTQLETKARQSPCNTTSETNTIGQPDSSSSFVTRTLARRLSVASAQCHSLGLQSALLVFVHHRRSLMLGGRAMLALCFIRAQHLRV